MNSPNDDKKSSPDDLVKTTSNDSVELTQEELKKTSGGWEYTHQTSTFLKTE